MVSFTGGGQRLRTLGALAGDFASKETMIFGRLARFE
jgi:hypothetical protein